MRRTCLLILACLGVGIPGAQASKPGSLLRVQLAFAAEPSPGTPVSLVLRVHADVPAPATTARIDLPSGFELLQGDPLWRGDLEAGQERVVEVRVQVSTPGYYRLQGRAVSRSAGGSLGGTAFLDLEVTKGRILLGSLPENRWEARMVPLPRNQAHVQGVLVLSGSPALGREITVTYRAVPGLDVDDARAVQLTLAYPGEAWEVVSARFPAEGESSRAGGQLSWKGALEAGQAVEIQATFCIAKPGAGAVYGSLSIQAGEGREAVVDVRQADLSADAYGGSVRVR